MFALLSNGLHTVPAELVVPPAAVAAASSGAKSPPPPANLHHA
jgi:hypothetical protein